MPGQMPVSISAVQPSRAWHAVTAGFLGWMLDAFDFFVLVFLVDTLASQFHVTKTQVVFTLQRWRCGRSAQSYLACWLTVMGGGDRSWRM